MSEPQSTPEALREAMARAIDPDAFDTAELDSLAHNHSAWAMLRDHYEVCQQKALRRADAALRAVPPGFVLVPRDPTEAMIQAACDATFGPAPMTPEQMHRAGYAAMTGAACHAG